MCISNINIMERIISFYIIYENAVRISHVKNI